MNSIDLIDEAGAFASLSRVPETPPPEVTEKTISQIISRWTSIPIGKVEQDEMDVLSELEENLMSRVKGQTRAIRGVSRAIRRARTGIRNPRRPVASFLFCGPTGTVCCFAADINLLQYIVPPFVVCDLTFLSFFVILQYQKKMCVYIHRASGEDGALQGARRYVLRQSARSDPD